MQTILQALQNITNALILLASPILVLALIVAGFNMASADGSRHDKAKKQLIGIVLAAVIIFGSRLIVSALISMVPGSSF
jgi:type IV secretory pathway VirB2 component (pilin)